jgi:hypothetical protein
MCGREHTAADHIKKIQAEDICRLRKSAWDEVYQFDTSSQQTVNSGPFDALPILILSRDISRGLPARPSQSELDRRNAWSQMQEDLKKLSTRSRRIVAKNSSHNIVLDRPDLIEKEVPVFIEEIRGSTPPPTTHCLNGDRIGHRTVVSRANRTFNSLKVMHNPDSPIDGLVPITRFPEA